MASLVTLASLRDQAQKAADMANSTFVSTADWNLRINNAAKELYDLLTGVFEDYYHKQVGLSLSAGGPNLLALPADFFKLISIDEISGTVTDPGTGIVTFTGTANTIKNFNWQERNRFRQPSGNRSMIMDYVPTLAPLVADSDTFDGINGWEKFIFIDAAIQSLNQEESDPSALMRERESIRERIKDMAPNRDTGEPDRMVDVNRVDPYRFLGTPTQLRYHVRGQGYIQFMESNPYIGGL